MTCDQQLAALFSGAKFQPCDESGARADEEQGNLKDLGSWLPVWLGGSQNLPRWGFSELDPQELVDVFHGK